MLRNNLEELSVGTVVHSRPRLRPIKEKSILPAIEITGVPDEPGLRKRRKKTAIFSFIDSI